MALRLVRCVLVIVLGLVAATCADLSAPAHKLVNPAPPGPPPAPPPPAPPPPAPPPPPSPDYQAIDLGTLGGRSSQPAAINDSGLIVGWSNLADGRRHAFVWDHTMHDLDPAGDNSSAGAISSSGLIAGGIGGLEQGSPHHPVIWRNGVIQYTGPVFEGVWGSKIDDNGDALFRVEPHIYPSARIYHAGQLDQIAGPDFGIASDFNTRGRVVGADWVGDETHGNNLPMIWVDGHTQELMPPRRATCWSDPNGCPGGYATDINEQGDVVGVFFADEPNTQGPANSIDRWVRPFLWRNGVMLELAVEPNGMASALHIN